MELKLACRASVADIKALLNDLQIYEYYIGKHLNIPCTIRSPFPDRKDERPSFSLFGRTSDQLMWKDHTLNESGDSIEFVMRLEGLRFPDAIDKIVADFKLPFRTSKTSYTNKSIPVRRNIETHRVIITTVLNKDHIDNPIYTSTDMKYWGERCIDDIPMRLLRNRCYSAKYVLKNDKMFLSYSDDNPIYAYLYKVDSEYRWKIYRPFAEKGDIKFFNDMLGVSDRCIHGLWYLPEIGNDLIITKSGKDCIVLDELGFNVIAVQSESTFINDDILADLKHRFNNIYLLFDNDYNKKENYGQLLARKVIDKYNFIKNMCLPDNYKCTDVDELICKLKDKEEVINIINIIKHNKI